MNKVLLEYFDFRKMYDDARGKTLADFPNFISYRDYMESIFPEVAKATGSTYLFIKSENHENILSSLEISKEIEFEYPVIDENAGTIRISFYEDTSYSNEGGNHPGGYTYDFIIDFEEMHIVNLKVTNHN